jgi:hypothetical protein
VLVELAADNVSLAAPFRAYRAAYARRSQRGRWRAAERRHTELNPCGKSEFGKNERAQDVRHVGGSVHNGGFARDFLGVEQKSNGNKHRRDGRGANRGRIAAEESVGVLAGIVLEGRMEPCVFSV